MSSTPQFPETWFISMAVMGRPNLLTRPRYSAIIARHLNAGHEEQQIIIRSHLLLPDQVMLLIQPFKMPLTLWMQDFIKDTAVDLCESLKADQLDERKEWFECFVNRNNNGYDVLWRNIEYLPVRSREEYESFEARMLTAPVKAGFVSNPDYYPYTWFNNRAGVMYTPPVFEEDQQD
jgi:hypothetical protein